MKTLMEILTGLGGVFCFFNLLEAILTQPGKWEVKARIWNEQDQKVLLLKECWYHDFLERSKSNIYMNPLSTLSLLLLWLNASMSRPLCFLLNVTWPVLDILQPLHLRMHFFGSQLYVDLSLTSATPSVTLRELINIWKIQFLYL